MLWHDWLALVGELRGYSTLEGMAIPMKLTLAAVGLCVLYVVPAFAEEKAETLAPRARADAFLVALQGGQLDTAVDGLVRDSPMLQGKPQELEVMKNQTKSMLPIYGPMLGFENVKDQAVGDSLIYLVFLARHEKHPISWRFVFYKAKDRWLLSAFKWSDSFEGLF
jgi:hypothetical protein